MENEEINLIEHYQCIFGPGGPADTLETCTAECVCEQPGCNCTPPEDRAEDVFEIKRFEMRDMIITCYPE